MLEIPQDILDDCAFLKIDINILNNMILDRIREQIKIYKNEQLTIQFNNLSTEDKINAINTVKPQLTFLQKVQGLFQA